MRILIIEDEYKLADMIRDFLTDEGEEAEICMDGLNGYMKARDERFDAIVLDVMLPGMDGFEVLSALREDNVRGIAEAHNAGITVDYEGGFTVFTVNFIFF